MRLLAALVALLIAVPAWADCPLDLGHGTGTVVYSDLYMLALRPDPLRIEIGQPFALLMNVCTKGGDPAELVLVDATMPEHKHGMNYRPTVTAVGDGRFRAEGLLLHMPGLWEIRFELRRAGASEVVSERFTLR